MERDPDDAPVTVDTQTVSFRSVRSELWVRHAAGHHDNLEIIRLGRRSELPAPLTRTGHATARLSMDCFLAQADVLAARSRAGSEAVVQDRLQRLTQLLLRDLAAAVSQRHDLCPSHHHLAERVRFSADAGASRSHTSRVFKRATGMTLSHYRQRGRVAAAVRRIATNDGTLADIASDVGFADQAHLCRSLVRATGCTPTTLRKRFHNF